MQGTSLKEQIYARWAELTKQLRACPNEEELRKFFENLNTNHLDKLLGLLKEPKTTDYFEQMASEQFDSLKKGAEKCKATLNDKWASEADKKSAAEKVTSVLICLAGLGRVWLEMVMSGDPKVQELAIKLLKCGGEIVLELLKLVHLILKTAFEWVGAIFKICGQVLAYSIQQLWNGIRWLGKEIYGFCKPYLEAVKKFLLSCYEAVKSLFAMIYEFFVDVVLPVIVKVCKAVSELVTEYPLTSLFITVAVGAGVAIYLSQDDEYATRKC